MEQFYENFASEMKSDVPPKLKKLLELGGYTNCLSISRLDIQSFENFVKNIEAVEPENLKELISPFKTPSKFFFLPGIKVQLEAIVAFANGLSLKQVSNIL